MALDFGTKIKKYMGEFIAPPSPLVAEKAQNYAHLLPDLTFLARTSVNSLRSGTYSQRRSGTGDSFWQYRGYEYGDSLRQIDWKASARFGETLILQKEAEQIQNALIHLPFTADMTFRPDANWMEDALNMGLGFIDKGNKYEKLAAKPDFIADKFSAALFIAACLMLVLQKSRHPFTVSARPDLGYRFTDDHMMEALDALCSTENHEKPLYSRKQHVFLINDFWDEPQTLKAKLIDIREQGGVPYIAQIISRDEINLTAKGHVLYQDMSLSDDFDIPLAEQIKDQYKDRIVQHLNEIDDICRGLDVYCGRYIMGGAPILDEHIRGHSHMLEFLEDMMSAISIPRSGIMA